MNGFEIAVLVVAGGASLWLIYYTQVYLPRAMDERFRESLKAFSTAVELRFPSHSGLSHRVVSLSRGVALQLNLRPAQLKDLEMSAYLRDIGLCAIPYELVNGKPEEDWTEAERMTYDRHAEVSGSMLEATPSLRRLAPIVRWHHSPFASTNLIDPTQPVGSQIPIESRILKVVSEYVWLERTQGDLLARETIRSQTDVEYCPLAANALLAVLTSTSGVQEPAQMVASRP